MATITLTPLQQTAMVRATDYWNDSCSIQELTYAIANGAVGATSNPTIVLAVLKKELPAWRDRIGHLVVDNSDLGRGRDCLETDRGNGNQGGRASDADF